MIPLSLKVLNVAHINKESFYTNVVWIAHPVLKLGYWPGNRRTQVRFMVNVRGLSLLHSVLTGS